MIRISQGILIEQDGNVRFGHSIGFLSFGFQTQKTLSFQYLKQEQLVYCLQADDQNQQFIPIQGAIMQLQNVKVNKQNEVLQILQIYKKVREILIDRVIDLQINKDIITQHDEQFTLNIQYCEQYMKEYAMQNQNQLY
ncbi:hypothetical protein ABPG72_018981 [Tetrahymena utriculariae]